MLIINADLCLLFSELEKLASRGGELYLASGVGDFLMHPEKDARFGSDPEHGRRFVVGDGVNEGLAVERRSEEHWPGRWFEIRVVLADEIWRPTLEKSRWRGIRHRLTTAFGRFPLAKLEGLFEELSEKGAERSLLTEAAAELERAAEKMVS